METTGKERVIWIDCAKGIAILAVIVGHTITNSFVKQVIYSFHMPLFFVASGLCYSYSGNYTEFKIKAKKSAKKLLVPGIIMAVVMNLLIIIFKSNELVFDKKRMVSFLLMLVWSRGDSCSIGEVHIPAMGLPWFMFALFYGRLLYDLIHLYFGYKERIVYLILAIVGASIGMIICPPFAIDIVLQICFYMYLGSVLKNDIGKATVKDLILYFIFWTVSNFLILFLFDRHIGMGEYQKFLVCYLSAFFAVRLVFEVCSWLTTKNKRLWSWLSWIGKNSFYLMIIHCFDFLWMDFIVVYLPDLVSVTKIVIDMLILMLLLKILEGFKQITKRRFI